MHCLPLAEPLVQGCTAEPSQANESQFWDLGWNHQEETISLPASVAVEKGSQPGAAGKHLGTRTEEAA